jgi:hypothetical protein
MSKIKEERTSPPPKVREGEAVITKRSDFQKPIDNKGGSSKDITVNKIDEPTPRK